MNRFKWQDQDWPDEVFSAKLSEEVGEVAQAHVKLGMYLADGNDANGTHAQRYRAKMVEELEHAEFIARCWREKLERDVAYHAT